MPSTDPILAAAAALREQHAELAAQRAVVDHQIAAIETCLTNLEAVYPAAKAPATRKVKKGKTAPRRQAARRPATPAGDAAARTEAVKAFFLAQREPVRLDDVRAAVKGTDSGIRYDVAKLVDAGVISAVGRTHTRRYGRPELFADGPNSSAPAPVATSAPGARRVRPPRQVAAAAARESAPSPPSSRTLEPCIRQQLDHGASFTVADLVRKAKAAGEQTTPEAVQAVLDQFVADGRVEKIPVGDGLRYRKRSKGGR